MSKASLQVDGYIRKNKRWQAELSKLREIILDCGLIEEIKWRTPCYMFEETNVVFIGCYSESCVMSFIKGVLLKDPKKILIQQTENSQSVRIIRFKDVEQIQKMQPTLKAYVKEAIANEKAGLKVQFKKIDEFAIPEELQAKFDQNTEFETAFTSLTPGRQRGYLLHFSGAKQSKTRTARIEKHMPRILDGKGLDDE